MWFCFNDGFVSAVQDRSNPETLVVRARRREILEALFPEIDVVEGGSTDYAYRLFVSKADFSAIVATRIGAIDYPNFKSSVQEEELHDLYTSFWELHYQYQK